ncbi:hypothetical protein [Mycobacterium sp. GA-2829]|uniref:hypothetical protein n=1 Tax=Mycobacterium sp. GA-2829 TaxID=1772283 RepID=UPI0007404812|nr:hypothetical protein [Mycobacterium sp. GA-2829]KUI39784.1 hypothetical protein AU194_24150 [Mycobacterium sp. GA-2829]
MVELQTRDQALSYLAQMSPTGRFHVQPFKDGWLCTDVLTPEQMASGDATGLAKLVIDSETGVVYVYPSWSETMVADAHTTFKETGVNRAGRQFYPYQWHITINLRYEDDERIEYQMTAESLTDPPEPVDHREEHIPLQSDGLFVQRAAMSHAEWMSRQNQGAWPEVDTTEV